jgi:hypothetical protein
MPETSRNFVALALLILAKALGIAGLIVGAHHRVAGGLLLALDGVFLVVAVAICLGVARSRKKEEQGQKEMLAKMVREGTLKQYLRDLERPSRPVTLDDGAAAE